MTLRPPSIDASLAVGGNVRLALDCGLVYEVETSSLIMGVAYTPALAREIERYYEPLTAVVVDEALRAWHHRVADLLLSERERAAHAHDCARYDDVLTNASGSLWAP